MYKILEFRLETLSKDINVIWYGGCNLEILKEKSTKPTWMKVQLEFS